MRQPSRERELAAGLNSINNSVMNQQHQILSLEEIHNHGQPQMFPSSNFDPTSSNDDFLEQILSSVPPSAASFPWAEDQPTMEEQSSAAGLASKMRHQQIGNGASAAKTLMLQQQLLLSRGLSAGNEGMPHGDYNDVVDGASPNYANLANDASIKALLNGFTGSLGQTSNQSQHFHHSQRGGLQQQSENFGAPAAPAMSQPAASGSTGQPRQRVRARRGQATDPHSIAERLRRERIAERMKSLQELVPNANKTDKASMLDEIIDYVKFLQLQVKVLSMSRLGGAAAASPSVANKSPEGRGGKGTQTAASSSNKNDGVTAAEKQVAKLMEEDMGSAMQYLQGKGLCLMPISLATAISTATGHSRNPLLHGGSGDAGGPLSPSLSALTVQSATMGGGDVSLKDTTAE